MQPPLRWLIPFATFLLRFLPDVVATALASVLADVAFVCLGDRRRILETNAAHILPGSSAADRRRLARATLHNIALTWLDFLRLPLLDAAGVRKLVEWDSQANLDRALAVGKGVILVTPHLGGIELAGAYVTACGYQVSGVVEDVEPRLFEVLRRYRSSTGLRTLPRRGPVAAFRVLRRGEVLVLVADRLLAGPGVAVPFCGGIRTMPTGPAAFALRTGSPIVLMYIVRLPQPRTGTRYRLVTEPMRLPSGSPGDITRLIAADFSRIVHASPDHWFVFQPKWIQGGADVEETVVLPDVTSSSSV